MVSKQTLRENTMKLKKYLVSSAAGTGNMDNQRATTHRRADGTTGNMNSDGTTTERVARTDRG